MRAEENKFSSSLPSLLLGSLGGELNSRPRHYQWRALTNWATQANVGAVGVEPTGPLRITVLQTDPTPYGTTHPFKLF